MPAKDSLSLSDSVCACVCVWCDLVVCGCSGIEFLQVQTDFLYQLGSSGFGTGQTRQDVILKMLQSAARIMTEMSPLWVC